MESSEKSQEKYSATQYIQALEEERNKIQVFQNELPLCFQLITQAIDGVKHNINVDDDTVMRSEKPVVLEEFLPLKPSSHSDNEGIKEEKISLTADKPDWLRSVQLWNQEPEDINGPIRPVAVKAKKSSSDGAFQIFDCKEKQDASTLVVSATSGETSTSGGDHSEENKSEKIVQTNRKARRCWSPELHRQFVQALKQLGGPQVATPKQIKELMDVEGLTNDEVKSHLQKYRLHTRRPGPSVQSSKKSSIPATPQFMVVSGIWVPSPECAISVASVGTTVQPSRSKGACTPIPALSSQTISEQQFNYNKKCLQMSPSGPLQSEGRCSAEHSRIGDEKHATNSVSTSSSSSSQTTTVSPLLTTK